MPSQSAIAYRAEAERCRLTAIKVRLPEDSQRWRQLAVEYDELARAYEEMYANTQSYRAASSGPMKEAAE